MNNKKHYLSAVAVLVGGAIALWVGLPPLLLILLLACPLMMFFMMRGGMHGGHGESGSSHGGKQASTRAPDVHAPHERIDRS